MKKSMIFLMLFAVFLVGSAPGLSPVLAAEFNIKLATYYSPNMLQGDKALAENIEKMSGGRIKIQIFAGGELVSSGDILKAVKSGVVDMGHGSGFHFPEVKIAAVEAGLPMAWTSAMDAQTLWDQFGFHELVAEAYEAQGVIYLGPYWAAPYAILSKKPIHSLADLQKMKIRATSGAGKMFAKVNVPTVYMKPEEIYTALSIGQIDGALYGGAVEYKEMKWYEVAPYYCTTFMLSPINDVLIFNPKLWQKLPDDLKAIVRSAAYWFVDLKGGA